MKRKIENNVINNVIIMFFDIMVMTLSSYILLGICNIEIDSFIQSGISRVMNLFMICVFISNVFLNMYNISFKRNTEVAACEFIACSVSGFLAETYIMIDWNIKFADIVTQRMLIAHIAAASVMIMLWRLILNMIITRMQKQDQILVIIPKNDDIEYAKKIKYAEKKWFKMQYVSVDTRNESCIDEIIKKEYHKHDGILITQNMPEVMKKRFIDEAMKQKKDVYLVPSLYEINITKHMLMQFGDTLAFQIKPFAMSVYQRVVKRILDVILCFVGVIVLSPVMLIAAIAIKLDSKGPVIYSQERVTLNKKRFNIYKFRTMIEDAEKKTGPKLATEDDDRITRVGKILRNYRIDELPQLFNILKGDMSIVGPRPERPVFVDKFCIEHPDYDKRFFVRAGLTGYAQTYGRYDTDVRDKLIYDLMYIREYSFLLDFKILFLTLKTVLVRNK